MSASDATTMAVSAVGRVSISRALAWLTSAGGLIAMAAGFAALLKNESEVLAFPALLLVALVSASSLVHRRFEARKWDVGAGIVGALSLAGVLVLLALPQFLYGYQLNGILHRSLFACVILFGVGVPMAAVGIGRILGGTPSSQDAARYPLLLLPVVLALGAYGMLLVRLISEGVDGLSVNLLANSYTETVTDAGFAYEAGLKNHILGTFMLIGMTSLISIPPGVGAGVFVSEFRGPLAHIVKFSTTMLRAVSVFIIGVAAFSLVDSASSYAAGDPISDFIRGYYTDINGFKHAAKGSFLTASLFLSLLVIPVIARSTEEGLRSVPREIREGSVAIGATQGHGLMRILLPWAAPNIITGLLLGAAEAAGSVAVLLFIAGTGQHGVAPLDEATSLSFAIFHVKYGPKPFQDAMGGHEFSAALLLLVITLGLTVAALLIKQRFAARYRGALTSE